MRALLVGNNNPMTTHGVASMLRRDALAIVEEIGGGQTALEVALQGNYNIILFDSSSSDRGGLDFIRRLRKSGNNTPLLVHSGPRYLAVKALDLMSIWLDPFTSLNFWLGYGLSSDAAGTSVILVCRSMR